MQRSTHLATRRSFSFTALVVFALSLLPALCFAQGWSVPSDAEIRAAIQNIPASHLPTDKMFDVFYRSPQRSTQLLIAALRPVPRGKYLANRHPLSVWIIRALKSLTGLTFKAPTRADLSSDEAHFLGIDEPQPIGRKNYDIPFFGTWMSRDDVWVAPRDSQLAIIAKWRHWFAEHGRDYNYVNDRDFDHWYF